jgi:hypothetical protein
MNSPKMMATEKEKTPGDEKKTSSIDSLRRAVKKAAIGKLR